jgi:hypothetical protein
MKYTTLNSSIYNTSSFDPSFNVIPQRTQFQKAPDYLNNFVSSDISFN